MFSIVVLIGLLLLYVLLLDGAREWYDRKQIIEKGSGRLAP